MSVSVGKIALPLLTAGAFVVSLSGCDSTGSYRVASIGSQGIQGPQGAQGPAGPQGAQGPAGQDGGNGLTGAGGLAGTNAVATGGLVGPGGVAGTGLLANTGDPGKPAAGSGVVVASGQAASNAANRGAPLAERVDNVLPGGTSITGRVIQTADNTGQALVRTGNGDEYLVDGLSAAPGTLVTVNTRDQRIVGRSGDQPLIGASALAPSASPGQTATVGAANQDRTVQVGSSATGTLGTGQPAGNPVAGVLGGQPAAPVTGVVQRVTQPINGLRRGN